MLQSCNNKYLYYLSLIGVFNAPLDSVLAQSMKGEKKFWFQESLEHALFS
jgi:hypothetical protein